MILGIAVLFSTPCDEMLNVGCCLNCSASAPLLSRGKMENLWRRSIPPPLFYRVYLFGVGSNHSEYGPMWARRSRNNEHRLRVRQHGRIHEEKNLCEDTVFCAEQGRMDSDQTPFSDSWPCSPQARTRAKSRGHFVEHGCDSSPQESLLDTSVAHTLTFTQRIHTFYKIPS